MQKSLNMNKNKKKPIIVIAGPTAVGKTNLSIDLAKRLDTEIISADSMQVYRGMDIGTAKAGPEEMKEIKHHLIDILDPNEEFNVQIFQEIAKAAINEIHNKKKIPIVVGGTGFYIRALLYDVEFENKSVKKNNTYKDPRPKLDVEIQALLLDYINSEKKTNFLKMIANDERLVVSLHEQLSKVDLISAENIHKNNVKRVLRALEYYYNTGQPISQHNKREREKDIAYDAYFYILTSDRNILYERINKRVEKMLEEGIIDEVNKLLKNGYTGDLISMQGIGYRQIVQYLNGEITLNRAIEILKRDTRRFAKRQITWFKKDKDARWIKLEDYDYDYEKIIEKILKDIEVWL